jgi:signal transduction histidine kinase
MRANLIRTRFDSKDAVVYLLKVMLLALAYHLAARLGLQMAYVQVNTSPVWPPTGIALAALLLFGQQLWPGVSLGVLLGSVLGGASLPLALGMALGNTLEALLGAHGLKRFVSFHNAIDRVQDVIGLALLSIVSTAISATTGTMTLILTGRVEWQGFGALWTTWWIGNLLGALVVTPMLLVWLTQPHPEMKRGGALEGSALLVLLAALTSYVFSNRPPVGIFHQATIYVIFPFVIWAALRFRQHGAVTATFLVSAIAILGTAAGRGPFSFESRNDSLVLLQTFLAVVSLTSLILAAATLESRRATRTLRQRVDDLATLNDSSRTFLDAFDLTALARTICQMAVTRLGADVAWIEMADGEGSDAPPLAAYGIAVAAIPGLKSRWGADPSLPLSPSVTVKTLVDLPTPAGGTDSAFQSYAVIPPVFSGNTIGALHLLSRDKAFFSEERQLLIQSYANLAAVAIQNAWLFEEVRKSNRQLHALSQRLMKAQEEERLHLSRELHDESGQLLAALTMQLGLLEREADQSGILSQRIAELKRTTNQVQDNLHQLAVDLRPASLDHLGLVTALEQCVAEFGRQYHIATDFEAVGMVGKRLPIEIEAALFRIVQESLTNVALHAQASRVDVLIGRRDKRVVATIEDDGVGFALSSSAMESNLGLFGMRERIEMLGGQFSIESSPGRGTTVHVEVPCDD